MWPPRLCARSSRVPRPWTVLRHGPVEGLEPNLWVVTSALPRGSLDRRMSVVQLSDGRLVFHNAVPLEEPAMTAIERHGEVAFLVVPTRLHRLDVHAWKERYPRCRVLAPPGSARAVARAVALDGGLDLLPRDPALEIELLDGTGRREAVLAVRSPRGTSLLFGDALMKVPRRGGLGGALLGLIGSSGGPRVTALARLWLVDDRRALGAHLVRLAATPGLLRLVPTHGPVVDRDPSGVLRAEGERLLR